MIWPTFKIDQTTVVSFVVHLVPLGACLLVQSILFFSFVLGSVAQELQTLPFSRRSLRLIFREDPSTTACDGSLLPDYFV
jgi:hypothetical protein